MGYATVRVNAHHTNGEMNVTCTERKRQRYRRPTPVVRQRYGNFFLTATVFAMILFKLAPGQIVCHKKILKSDKVGIFWC